MKAVAAVPATQELKLVAYAEPRLTAPTEVKLRVLEVGVWAPTRRSHSSTKARRPLVRHTLSSVTNRWPRSSPSLRR